MGYIQGEKHFFNYLNKVIRESPSIDTDALLSGQFYKKEIFNAGLADDYTYALRTRGGQLLEEKHVLKWLATQRTKYIEEFKFAHTLTPGFIELLEDLGGVCGVYCFVDVDGDPLYVGRSIRLGQRMLSSFGRFSNYNRPISVKYVQTNSMPDAILLEAYFIAMLNPPFNHKDNYSADGLTLTLGPIPEWSEPVGCNLVVYGEV